MLRFLAKKILAVVNTNTLALGDSTYTEVTNQTKAQDGPVTDTATTTTTAIARGDSLASTEVTGLSYTDGGDGEGAGVEVGSTGVAIGDGSVSTTKAWTFAASFNKFDIAIGFAQSSASGETYQTTDGWISLEGDVTASHVFTFDSPIHSFTSVVGIAVNTHDYGLFSI